MKQPNDGRPKLDIEVKVKIPLRPKVSWFKKRWMDLKNIVTFKFIRFD